MCYVQTCPFCKRGYPVLHQIADEFKGAVQVRVFIWVSERGPVAPQGRLQVYAEMADFLP